MRFKINLLTILVGVLSVLSFYVVITDTAQLPVVAKADQGSTLSTRRNGAFLLPISEPTLFPIRDTDLVPPELTAKSFLIYDTKNAKVIFSKDPSRPLPVASLTKLLTAIISLQKLTLEEPIQITGDSFNVDGEGADFHLQEQLSFKDLLGAMLIKSSNDAAMAVAKTVEQKTGGNFVGLMNRTAKQIGMTNSRFLDPAGLNDEAYTTARDFLQLVQYSRNYPEIWRLIGTKSLEIVSTDGKFAHHLESTNKLWGVVPNLTGGKTGYTDGALGCMIIEENLPEQNSSLVIILFGSTDRFGEIKKLSDWSKTAFRWQ